MIKRISLLNYYSYSFLIIAFLLLASTSLKAQTNGDYRTIADGNWNINTTWQVYNNPNWRNCTTGDYPGAITTAGAVSINHNVILPAGVSASIGSLYIDNGKKLTVNGTLIIERDLFMHTNGDLTLGNGSVVIVKGNFSGGNNTQLSLSSYLIVYGNMTILNGGNSALSINNAHIYVLGTVSSANNYFTSCNDYDGTTSSYSETCDAGTFEALINNTSNPDPVIENIIEQVIAERTIDINNLSSVSSCICLGGSVTLTINESGTIELLKWYRGTSLLSNLTTPSKPYNYTANQADTYNALYKIGTTWYQTNSVAITSKQPPTASISGSTNICAGSSATITISLNGEGPWNFTYSDGTTPVTVSGQTTTYTVKVSPTSTTTYTLTSISNACCAGTTSGTATITVNSSNVLITGQPAAGQTKCLGNNFDPISVVASATTGSITGYQWYSNTIASNSGGTPISGAIAASYTPLATSSGTRYYYCVVTGTCGSATSVVSGAFVVNPTNTVSAASSTPTICINTVLTNITHTTTGATGIGTATGLPAGVIAAWASNTITISGTPTEAGTFNYSIPLTGGCGNVNATGTITVTPASVAGTVTPASAQVCLNTGTTLTLSGYTGSIQWQTNSSGSWQNIPGATSETYNTPNLTKSTSFRAVVANGICSNATSNEVTIILDQVLPTFSNCPANRSVNVDQGLCSAIVEWDIPSATDNCGTPTIAVIANEPITTIGGKHRATIAVGTSTIKYTATDNNGNLQTCTFTITVTDNIAPQISCPQGQSVFCAENAPIYSNLTEFTAAGGTATDNCSLNAGSFTRLTDVSNGNVLTRTYQISDAAGNSSTCEQIFTISQPSVSIQSQNTTTCIGGTFSITSTISPGFGAVNYQWQKRANSASPWNDIAGATSSQLDGTLGSYQEEYCLLVSQATGFTEACSPASEPLKFSDTQAPVFSGYAPQNQVLCTAPGATTVAASGMSIEAIDVIDNCTLNLSTSLSYTITGAGATGVQANGINLPENPQFNVGTSTVTYTVSDTYGNVGTHTVTIVVQAAPAPITITYSSGGNQPTQCSGYTYSVDGGVTQPGYTYEWKVLSGATPVISGFSVTNAGTGSVSITWTGDLPAGNYTLEATKRAANGCESKATLAIALQNSFNLIVNDPGQDCKGESIGLKIIDWQITRPCGTSDYSFKYVIAAGEWNTLSEAQAHQILGMPITISNTSDNPRIIKQTVNYTINVYNTEVFTLFIYDQVDANGQTDVNATDDHHHFYLKGIPNTSPISTD